MGAKIYEPFVDSYPFLTGGMTMKTRSRFTLSLVLFLIGILTLGCATYSLNHSHSPETLGKIGARINQNPDRKPSILSEYNLSSEEFRKSVRKIAADPALSERYHEGFKSVANDT